MVQAYPLSWPSFLPRTENPKRSQFATPQATAQLAIQWELKRLGAGDVVISTNQELKANGFPYAKGLRADEDNGVAVYYTLGNSQQCIAIDKWLSVADNMQAIAKTIEAMRGLERWGGKTVMNSAFSGFKALPESTGQVTEPAPLPKRPWYEVLQVSQQADFTVVKAAYRSLAGQYHPDSPTADNLRFLEVQTAYNEAKEIYNS